MTEIPQIARATRGGSATGAVLATRRSRGSAESDARRYESLWIVLAWRHFWSAASIAPSM